MTKLHIADQLSLPPDAVTQTFGLLAVRGAGKTNAARVMAEEMFDAGLPFVAVDPVGSWWGLRAGRDGGPGLAIPIFGGKRGDVPLERTGGQLLADLIVDQRLSCVVDLSEFETEAAKKAFLVDFAKRLYHRNEEPLHLFLEEADDYIPQRPMRDETVLLRAWENIVRRGRSRGLGMTLITQRSASINKSVLTQVQTLIAMRTTGPQDRAAIEEWVKYNGQSREILASLASLAAGEAWVWSPQFLEKTVRIRFRLSRTLDSGATPKVGKTAKAPATLADVDLVDIQERMAATIEKAKQDDPRELRRTIAELQRQLASKPAPAADATTIAAAVQDAVGRRDAEWSERFEQLRRHADELGAKLAGIRNLAIANGAPSIAPPAASSPRPTPAPIPRPAPARGREQPAKAPPEGLRPAHQRLLNALAWLHQFGITTPARNIVAAIAGVSPRSSSFENDVSRLSATGLIRYPSKGLMELTDAGNAIAEFPERPPTVPELHDAWRRCPALRPAHVRLLNVVLERYPAEMTRDELAAAAGVSSRSSSFENDVSRLSSLGLVRYPSRGLVVANGDVLFPHSDLSV